MPASEVLRRAAALVAAGWSPDRNATDAQGETAPLYGGTTGDTARAGVNKAIANHTLYTAVVTAAHEQEAHSGTLATIWDALYEATSAAGARHGGTNNLHPVHGYNVTEGRTAEQVQALLNQVADELDPSKPRPATPLPPNTL